MPCAQIRSKRMGVLIVLLAPWIGDVNPAVAADDGQSLPLADSLAQAEVLAHEGRHADALRTVIMGLEAHPNELDHEGYDTVRRQTFDWFGKLSEAERSGLVSGYASTSGGETSGDGGLLAQFLEWLSTALPTLSIKTPGGMLVLAGWHRQLGDHLSCVAYAMTAFERGPRTSAGEHAVQVLMTWQYYGFDREGMVRTARVASKIDPDGWPAAWAVCRMVWHYGSRGRIDEAKQLCTDIQTSVPGSRAAGVAAQLSLVVRDVESMSYAPALDRLWDLREYFFDETDAEEIMDTIFLGIDWAKCRTDAESRHRIDELTRAAEAEARRADEPLRGASACLVLGELARRQGRRPEAVEHFQRAAESRHWAVEELALKQLGRLLYTSDPRRAIDCLERWRDRYQSRSVGNEVVFKRLAGLYQKEGRYQEALDLYQELERRCQAGQAVVDVSGRVLTSGIVGCLRGLGRHDEANALAGPLLERYGYGTPVEALTREQLGTLYLALTKMGRTEEAAELRREMRRRTEEERAQQQQ